MLSDALPLFILYLIFMVDLNEELMFLTWFFFIPSYLHWFKVVYYYTLDVNSINFWKCLKNKTCPIYSTTRRNSASLCNFDKCVSITWTPFQKRNLSLTISSKGEIGTGRFINTSIENPLGKSPACYRNGLTTNPPKVNIYFEYIHAYNRYKCL